MTKEDGGLWSFRTKTNGNKSTKGGGIVLGNVLSLVLKLFRK